MKMTTKDQEGSKVLDDTSLDDAQGGAGDMFIKIKGVAGESEKSTATSFELVDQTADADGGGRTFTSAEMGWDNVKN